ncbi:unnamed protein product [Durusdinium trenchii]|uniref:HTH La-type RNA-binding domain-containing protein n=1 Tax=Durusdinium trenchii TaxID=1381693 RepID=A0ABP0SZQ5_9DINO
MPHFVPAWWDRFFVLDHSYSHTSLSIHLRKAGLHNADVASLSLALQSFLTSNVDPKLPLHIELDASENDLDDLSVARILQILQRNPGSTYLRSLKLYKNRVSDLTCAALASFLWNQTEACEEIHLSHNEIGHRGVAMLLAVLAMHPKEAYPRSVEHLDEAIPCWLRLEHNQATSIEHLLSALEKDPVRLRYCMAPRGETASCSVFRCSEASANKEETPHAHLYCITKQKENVELTEQPQLETMVLSIADAVVAGRFDLPQADPVERHVALPAPEDAVLCRKVQLHVDAEQGAGLEMTVHSYGYHVDKVEEQPGQDLEPGDVLLSVDGEALWGDLSEDELNEVFGREFADGATVLTAKADAVDGCHVWQPLGTDLCRAAPLIAALREDLGIMGNSFGVSAELDEEGAVWLRGPAGGQRGALAELPNLVRFYFPELRDRAWPSHQWVKANKLGENKNGRGSVSSAERVDPVEVYQDLTEWQSALRKQCKEDDDIFDEDLPVEPLEAPDEGPEIFEGETILPELDMSRPFKMLILVGFPGSGKSCVAARLAAHLGYDIVNQDTLGDRKACVQAAREALAECRRLVVDRCNCTRLQRRVWLELADDYEVGAACIWLDIPEEICDERVLQRFGHRTLPPEDKSLEVIDGFAQRFEPPMEAEGFVRWRVKDDGDLEEALAEYEELVKESEAGSLEAEVEETPSEAPSAPRKRRRLDAEAAAAGVPKADLHGRASRSSFLRDVRRQVEYYFSDRNLKKDWFFQDKITSEPEPGWLELQWIMSCPRIAQKHQAKEKDVLEALKSSVLSVKEADGCHWVARSQPLPPLEVERPESELLHNSVNQEEEHEDAEASKAQDEPKGSPEEADLAVQRLQQDADLEASQDEDDEELSADPYM